MYRIVNKVRKQRFVTIQGPPGCGKTAVVAGVCQYLAARDTFPCGIVHVKGKVRPGFVHVGGGGGEGGGVGGGVGGVGDLAVVVVVGCHESSVSVRVIESHELPHHIVQVPDGGAAAVL